MSQYEFDSNKDHIFGIKSAILWKYGEKGLSPVLYLRKPKHVSQEEYDELIQNMQIYIKREKAEQ